MPKYGGWCAYTTANSGEKFDVNPFNCTIENKELYLFYKTCFTDNREKWIQIPKELKTHFINQILTNTEKENV